MKTTAAIYGRALLIVALSAASTTRAAAAGEVTPTETKVRMIQLIGELESDPFATNSEEIRGEVMSWLTDAPDVTVKVCARVLGDIDKIKGDEGETLVVQLVFSEAKFILEHPDKATDQRAINVAGVEGVLKTYAAMKIAKPKLAIREFDQLVKLQASGQLGAAIDTGLAECG